MHLARFRDLGCCCFLPREGRAEDKVITTPPGDALVPLARFRDLGLLPCPLSPLKVIVCVLELRYTYEGRADPTSSLTGSWLVGGIAPVTSLLYR